MSPIKCSKCGTEFDDSEQKCPKCKTESINESSDEPVNENTSLESEVTEEISGDNSVHNPEETTESNNIVLSESSENISEIKSDDKDQKEKTKKNIIGFTAAVIVIIILFATKIICIHEWQDATCTSAQTCVKCEKIKGEALGHEWEEATCTAPKTCSVCNETEGESLEHVAGETIALGYNFVLAHESKAQVCKKCSETFDITEIPLDSFHNGSYFLFTVDEFVDRLNYIFADEYELSACEASVSSKDGNMEVEITRYSESIYIFFFKDADNMMDSTDEANINNLIIAAEDTYTEAIYGVTGVIMACDPSVTASESLEILTETLNTAVGNSGKTYYKNGITYAAAELEGLMLFSFRLE